jgi:hypothetical protein
MAFSLIIVLQHRQRDTLQQAHYDERPGVDDEWIARLIYLENVTFVSDIGVLSCNR